MAENPFAELDSLLAQPASEIKTKDISGEDALDILEVAAQSGEPEQTATELKELLEFTGESVQPVRDLVEEQESAVLGDVLQEQLQVQLVDPTLSIPDKVAAAEFVDKNTTIGNLLFSDIIAGQHVRQMVDDNKRLYEWMQNYTPAEFTAEYKEAKRFAEEHDFPLHMHPGARRTAAFRPELTKFDVAQWQQGFSDRYLTEIFALPHLLHLGGKQNDLDVWT